MNKKEIIKKTENFVKDTMKGDPGHDWSHVERVRNMALYIAKREKADLFVVELAAILHDVADHKFHGGNDKIGSQTAARWLYNIKIDPVIIQHICSIIDHVSFKGAKVAYDMETLEGKIIWDADKLDALGAIGIARAFSYGGFSKSPMHDPRKKVVLHKSFAQYKNSTPTTINHFYEKLLLLKDRMHTKTAKKIAARRHKFLKLYLKEFYSEWEI